MSTKKNTAAGVAKPATEQKQVPPAEKLNTSDADVIKEAAGKNVTGPGTENSNAPDPAKDEDQGQENQATNQESPQQNNPAGSAIPEDLLKARVRHLNTFGENATPEMDIAAIDKKIADAQVEAHRQEVLTSQRSKYQEILGQAASEDLTFDQMEEAITAHLNKPAGPDPELVAARGKYLQIFEKEASGDLTLEELNKIIESKLAEMNASVDDAQLKKEQAAADLHRKRLKDHGPNYIIAEKKGNKTVFSAITWSKMTGDKEGWRQVVETPEEVKALRK